MPSVQIAADALKSLQSEPTIASGQAAVERAAAELALGGANVARRAPGRRMHRSCVWPADADLPPDRRRVDRYDLRPAIDAPAGRAVPVAEDYFALAASRPDVGAALALGPDVIIVVDGVAYRTVGADQPGDPIPAAGADFARRRLDPRPTGRTAGGERRQPPLRREPAVCRRGDRAGGVPGAR